MLISEFIYQRKKKENKAWELTKNTLSVGGTAAMAPVLLLTKRGRGPINSLLTGTKQGVQKGIRGKINSGAAAVGKRIIPKAIKNQAKDYTKGAINENLTLQTTAGLTAGGIYLGKKALNRDKKKKY